VLVVLLVGGLGVVSVFVGRQLLARFAGSQRPEISALPGKQPTPVPAATPQPTPQPQVVPQATPDITTATDQAQRRVDEGYAKEKAGNLQGAIADYEEALKLTQDRKLADHIQKLKLPISQTAGLPTSQVRLTEQMVKAAKTLYSKGNIYAVENGAKRANVFSVSEPMLITYISTYHWNGGKGKPPGVIALENADGTKYGGWNARGINGQGGVPNATWAVVPGVVLKPGQYTLLDSHPPTWSQNPASGGQGMCEIRGLPWSHASSLR
jgi:hypothetical protein